MQITATATVKVDGFARPEDARIVADLLVRTVNGSIAAGIRSVSQGSR